MTKTTTWYVRPKNAHTNQCIATGAFPDAVHETSARIKGEDKPVNLIEVDHQTLLFIERSKLSMALDFDVFVKTGGGKIRPSPFVKGRLIRSHTHSA